MLSRSFAVATALASTALAAQGTVDVEIRTCVSGGCQDTVESAKIGERVTGLFDRLSGCGNNMYLVDGTDDPDVNAITCRAIRLDADKTEDVMDKTFTHKEPAYGHDSGTSCNANFDGFICDVTNGTSVTSSAILSSTLTASITTSRDSSSTAGGQSQTTSTVTTSATTSTSTPPQHTGGAADASIADFGFTGLAVIAAGVAYML